MQESDSKFKQRMSGLFLLLFFLFAGVGIFWLSVTDLIDYLHPKQVVLFARVSVFFLFSPILFIPLCCAGGYCLFTGEMSPPKLNKWLLRLSIFFIIVSTVSMVLFSLGYPYYLESLGYTACPGIPMGWMPGMAVEYVLNAELCNK